MTHSKPSFQGPPLWVLIILLLIAYFAHLGLPGLRAEEPRRAVVAIDAYLGDNPWVPSIHNEPYYNKPPFYNWVLSAFYSITGSMEEWVVRLPGAISVWLTALLLFLIGKRESDTRTALTAALIYLTSADLFFYGAVNAGEIDLFYSLVTFAQALCIFVFFHRKKWWLLFAISYLLTAIGLLTKGLPSLAFQALPLLGVFIYYRNFLRLVSIQHVFGIVLMALPIAGYFLYYNKFGDAAGFAINLFSESSSKSANESPITGILLHLPSFPLNLIKLLLPWSLLLIPIAIKRKMLGSNRFLIFSLIFIVANIWIYWISPETRNRYLYMFFPFFAFIFAFSYRRFEEKELFQKSIRIVFLSLSALSAILFIAIPFLPKPTAYTDFALIKGLIIAALILVFFVVQIKNNRPSFIYFITVIALVRIGYNLLFLPTINLDSRSAYYEQQIEKMLEITGYQPIGLSGSKYEFKREIKLGGTVFAETELATPPLLAYQIPYYYTLQTGQILTYWPSLNNGQYFLLPAEDFKPGMGMELHRFKDKWIERELVLIRAENP